jgi:hypothetical protein
MSLKAKISLLKKKADNYDELKKKYNQLKYNTDSILNFQNHKFLNLYQNKDQDHEHSLDKISYFSGEIDDLKADLINQNNIIKNLKGEINQLEDYVQNRQNIINELSIENTNFKGMFDNITTIWTRHIRQRDDEIVFLKELILIKDNEVSSLKKQITQSWYQKKNENDNSNPKSSFTNITTSCLAHESLNLDCASLTGENNEHVKHLVNSLNQLLNDSIDETHDIDWDLLDDNEYNNDENNA